MDPNGIILVFQIKKIVKVILWPNDRQHNSRGYRETIYFHFK